MEKPNFTGTLNDLKIKEFCEESILISENYNKKNISQACYELRASSIYYDLENPAYRINIEEEDYGYILIKPHQTIVIITEEELKLPNYILGRILSKGKLFSLGLLPVNTYADPGFEGNLGLVFHNSSTNYLKIQKGDKIAKIEFSVLHHAVESTYSGQHGYKTEHWPVLNQYFLKEEEIKNDKRIGSNHSEMVRMYGRRYSQVLVRILNFEKKLIWAGIMLFILNFVLIILSIYFLKLQEVLAALFSVTTGLVTSLIAGLIMIRWGKS